jgi:uncharacterized protein (TIGR03435 family)
VLLSIWISGFVITASIWIARWRAISRLLRAASPLPLRAPIPIKSTRDRLEPGVFGIRKPVLLLPEGIEQRLSPAQLRAILTHELAHVRRRDNLTAAIHMLVEAIFWFHPLVWWIETRLVEERELACDEAVLCSSAEPEAYASGILEVCKHYLEAPLVCMSGVSGSDLKKRIAAIMINSVTHRLDFPRKLLLAAAAIAAVAGPLVIGAINAPALRAQSHDDSAPLAFEVASVKPSTSDDHNMFFQFQPGGRVVTKNLSLHSLISIAYDLPFRSTRLTGGPSWVRSDGFYIEARAPQGTLPPGLRATEREARLKKMLRSLLAERFHLTLRREMKETNVFAIVIGKGGPKLKKSAIDEKDCPDGEDRPGSCHVFNGGQGRGLQGEAVDMSDLVLFVSNWTDRPMIDKTGLTGLYSIQTPGWLPLQMRPDGTPDGENANDPNRPSLFGIFDMLGLKLESQKAPVEMFIIEHAEKPSAN